MRSQQTRDAMAGWCPNLKIETSGAKAPDDFYYVCGTAEAVPFQNIRKSGRYLWLDCFRKTGRSQKFKYFGGWPASYAVRATSESQKGEKPPMPTVTGRSVQVP